MVFHKLNKGSWEKKDCICEVTLSILGKHKLPCEKEHIQECWCLLLLSECMRGLPLPHLP